MPKLSNKAIQEIKDWGLDQDPVYADCLDAYMTRMEIRPPSNTTATKNMLKALRMLKWHNTADDWARLHATEAYLKKRR